MEIISFKRGENEGALFIHGEKKVQRMYSSGK